jgi:hypothetical protein
MLAAQRGGKQEKTAGAVLYQVAKEFRQRNNKWNAAKKVMRAFERPALDLGCVTDWMQLTQKSGV